MPGYESLRACLDDLERHRQLVRVREEVDPHLEMAEIQRRAYRAKAPAILFEKVKGSDVQAVCNVYGTIERCEFIFRDTLDAVRDLARLKAEGLAGLKRASGKCFPGLKFPGLKSIQAACNSLPQRISLSSAPVAAKSSSIRELPQVQCWPSDGGAFITLPQVYSEDADHPGWKHSNLGMYRVQLSGNDYREGEIGLHYQLHRGLGIHHAKAIARGQELKISIFVGGSPAHALAAVMPLPEGMSELMFAGMLAGRRFRYADDEGFVVSADADFCVTGTLAKDVVKPEGPFGDHLGYYSLKHDFPVFRVRKVTRRKDAVWPFTVVGRPPQEDTSLGELIHRIAGPMVPKSLPGVKALHAVDAAGVHPLLLAVGSERYMPYQDRRPQEILTQANAILGFNQCSLAKYLWIAAGEDDPTLDIHDVKRFFTHVLERVDLEKDLHFQTRTTIDTLDYSGEKFHEGSKLVIAAAGKPRRTLAASLPAALKLPDGFGDPRMVFPGVAVIQAKPYTDAAFALELLQSLGRFLHEGKAGDWRGIPLVVVVDDSAFAAKDLENFLWVTFTRSNPSHDCHGAGEFVEHKHWGCRGPLLIDARIKPHHAPPLEVDAETEKKVDALCATGKSLHGVL